MSRPAAPETAALGTGPAASQKSGGNSFKERFRKQWEQFRDDTPGERFEKFHQRRREERGGAFGWGRAFLILAGIVLFFGGLFMLPAPGPGMVVVVAGLAILAGEFRFMARFLDWAELRIRPAAEWAVARWKSLTLLPKGLLVLAAVLGGAALAYGFYLWRAA
jgi:uncharacterized protein (TIGR02611 family)